MPLTDAVAAISAGIVDGAPLLDLNYEEDSRAEVDFNVVMTAKGIRRVAGLSRKLALHAGHNGATARLGSTGISELLEAQRLALGETN